MKKGLTVREVRSGKYVTDRCFLNEKGNIEGIYETYSNGLPFLFIEYKDGVADGVIAKYNRGLLQEILHKDRYGRMQGIHEVYNSDGSVVFSHKYLDGIRVEEYIPSEDKL